MKINPITNNIPFNGGLKNNLRQGESVLREFKKDFPYIKSFTLWQHRLDHFKKDDDDKLEECQFVALRYADEIDDLRLYMNLIDSFNNDREKHIKCLQDEVKQRGCGNCGEITEIISGKLREKGIKHMNVRLNMVQGNSFENHAFNVIGMNKKADPKKPSTWGNNAVIIDGWRNFVLSAKDGIREYEKFYDTRHFNQIYTEINFDKIKNKFLEN